MRAKMRQSKWLRWIIRILVGLLAVIVISTGAALTYQAVATAADRRAYPPPGQLIDVGGYWLHIVCMGDGSPTVILDALGDGTSANWGWVQPVVAKTTRVCAYDRAGRGWSEAGPPPRDARTYAQELHTLLLNAEIEGPKILVGHSFGALVSRVYVDLFPEDVVGVVWVDPGLPGLNSDRMPQAAHDQAAADQELMTMAPLMARLGIFRLIQRQETLPEPQRSYAQAFYSSNELWDSLYAESQMLTQSQSQWNEAADFGDRPFMIVSATQGWADPNAPMDESRRIYNLMQEESLVLSTNHALRVVESASHASIVMAEPYATETSDAIVAVVEAVRNGQPLQ